MKFLIMISFGAVFMSCSSVSHNQGDYALIYYSERPSRDLASIEHEREAILESPFYARHFQHMFSQEDASELFKNLFDEQLETFYYNQILVYLYKEFVKRERDPMKSEVYTALWEGRHVKEHNDEILLYSLLRLDQIASRANGPDREKADDILENLLVYFSSLGDHQKSAFVDVFERFDHLQISLHSSDKSDLSTSLMGPFRQFVSPYFSWGEFSRTNREELKQETTSRYNLEEMYEEFISEDAFKRTQIRPSVGEEGNITGNELPNGVWALTFDDGPHTSRSRAIADMLDRAGIEASFFWLAQRARRHPETIRYVQDLGMELANHSYTHANVPRQSYLEQYREIVESTDLLERLYGERIKFFRLPFASGTRDPQVRQLIADRDMIHVFWNIDSLDWQLRDPQKIFELVVDQMRIRGGGIILLHDIHQFSVDATELLIDYIQSAKAQGENLRFMSLEKIVDGLNSGNFEDHGREAPRREDQVDEVTPRRGVLARSLSFYNVPEMGFSGLCEILGEGTEVDVYEEINGFYRVRLVSRSLRERLSHCGEFLYISPMMATPSQW